MLTRICRQWRIIACGTPKLWAALRIARWKGPGLALLAQLWLRRAGGTSKSLSLRFSFYRCPSSFFTTTDRCQCCRSSSTFTEHWANLSSFHGTYFTPAECLALLSRAPRLAHCKFDEIQKGLLPSAAASRLVLPNLAHLSLHSYSSNIQSLLDSLACPILRSFDFSSSFRGSTDTLFLSFLKRAPHIETFAIAVYSFNLGTLTTILHAMPNLTSLRVAAEDTATFHLLHLLSASPTFLPRISNIPWADFMIKDLVDAVTSRWEAQFTAQLLDFELTYANSDRWVLDHRIVACVSALREKGMRIHVGRPRQLVSRQKKNRSLNRPSLAWYRALTLNGVSSLEVGLFHFRFPADH
ncbi:hypothetical protein C8R46DRAFT_1187316 [Mycena filopes]|nr:hypothetical protein C8R46DRAFT_1187316 [Mycena filopes]